MDDMYPWDQQADARDAAAEAVRAVQASLDLRDNGGAASVRTPAAAAGAQPLWGTRGE